MKNCRIQRCPGHQENMTHTISCAVLIGTPRDWITIREHVWVCTGLSVHTLRLCSLVFLWNSQQRQWGCFWLFFLLLKPFSWYSVSHPSLICVLAHNHIGMPRLGNITGCLGGVDLGERKDGRWGYRLGGVEGGRNWSGCNVWEKNLKKTTDSKTTINQKDIK